MYQYRVRLVDIKHSFWYLFFRVPFWFNQPINTSSCMSVIDLYINKENICVDSRSVSHTCSDLICCQRTFIYLYAFEDRWLIYVFFYGWKWLNDSTNGRGSLRLKCCLIIGQRRLEMSQSQTHTRHTNEEQFSLANKI